MLILPDHLPHEILNGNFLAKPALRAATPYPHSNKLDEDQIRQVLAHTDWNIAKSARLLGIARNTLYQKMNALNLVSSPRISCAVQDFRRPGGFAPPQIQGPTPSDGLIGSLR